MAKPQWIYRLPQKGHFERLAADLEAEMAEDQRKFDSLDEFLEVPDIADSFECAVN
jgi:hypothetical protein